MRWLWADWGGRDRPQQTQQQTQAHLGWQQPPKPAGRQRSRSQTRPRVALAAQAAATATTARSLGSATVDTSAMSFFAPAVAPASTVAALYWEAGRNTWEPRTDVRNDSQGEWRDAHLDAGGAHNTLPADPREAARGQRAAAPAAATTAPATASATTASAATSAATERRERNGNGGAKASRRARHGLTTTLLRATAIAAEALGRAPEEVWAEALSVWLASQQPTTAADAEASQPARQASAHARPIEVRRQEVWGEIDATLSALRAS